jgi:hypothetical protein
MAKEIQLAENREELRRDVCRSNETGMITVKLMGGLGNQMFQYAAGRALSVKHGVPLLLDESFLNQEPDGNYTKRNPELFQLQIKAEKAENAALKRLKQGGLFNRFFTARGGRPKILTEGNGLNQEFFSLGSHAYLDGYWQSEEYFKNIRNILVDEFRPTYALERETSNYIALVQVPDSVSVHVRRGDYVSLEHANKFHGVLGIDYYTEAMNLMKRKAGNCHFFIFSDDTTWCRQNFGRFEDVTIVENPSKFSSSDLMLMKRCNHHIIANSSYSWWGAWLSESGGSITIAPSKWLNATDVSIEKFYCKNWIRI